MADDASNLEAITPPPEAIDIGSGHKMQFSEFDGETAGITEWHLKPDGQWCRGWVPFNQSSWGRKFQGTGGWQGWDVQQRDPLTLTPSILCRACGSHGFITNGQRVSA